MEKIRKPATSTSNGGEIDSAVGTKITEWDSSSKKADSNGPGLVAPRKGQYALTVTGTGWTPGRSVGVYYQDQDGNHRLKFNIEGTATSSSNITLSVSGVLFKALTRQALAVTPKGGSPLVMYAYCDAFSSATDDIFVNCTTTFTTLSISGDVELESKPSWA